MGNYFGKMEEVYVQNIPNKKKISYFQKKLWLERYLSIFKP
jgi:hypothetical protein